MGRVQRTRAAVARPLARAANARLGSRRRDLSATKEGPRRPTCSSGPACPGSRPRPARRSPRRRRARPARAPAPDRSVPPLDACVDVAGRRLPPRRAGRGARRRARAGPDRPLPRSSTPTCARSSWRPAARCARRCAARLDAAQLADHPATELTFAEALAFCAWAGARLPTGAEWEAAARGADGRPWPWGDTFDPDRCACAEAGAAGPRRSAPIPSGAAPCGAEQLAGNVWEWVADPPDEDGWRVGARRLVPRPRLGRPRLARARRRPRARHAHHRLPHREGSTTTRRTTVNEARAPDRDAIVDALRDVYDPCCADRGVSIVDMGVVEDVRVDGAHVDVDLVLTTGWCPFVASMSTAIPERLQRDGRRRDRRGPHRLGPRVDAWTACPSPPATSSRCRSRSSSPTASVGSPRREEPDHGHHRDPARRRSRARAQGQGVRLRLRLPHLQLRPKNALRAARGACSTSTSTPSTSSSRARARRSSRARSS